MAARLARGGQDTGSLDALRAVVVGSEQIPALVLNDFAIAFAPCGFRSEALCPAYGLAENVLAVSLTPPATPWRTHAVAAGRLHEGRWQPTILAEDPDAVELTDCGPPLPGVSVRTAGSVDVGPLELSAPSLADGYLTRAEAVPVRTGDWFRTTDVGRATPSSVVVAGRSDDVFVLAGRKIFAQDLEKAASAHPAVRAGCCAAIVVGGELQVIAEPSRAGAELERAAADIASLVSARTGIRPRRVAFVERSSLPKTANGKLQRSRVAALIESGGLPPIAEPRRGGTQ